MRNTCPLEADIEKRAERGWKDQGYRGQGSLNITESDRKNICVTTFSVLRPPTATIFTAAPYPYAVCPDHRNLIQKIVTAGHGFSTPSKAKQRKHQVVCKSLPVM